MRSSILALSTIAWILGATAAVAEDGKAVIVESGKIWEQQAPISATELVRFQDQWYCVATHTKDEPLRVLRDDNMGDDGSLWERVALIHAPKPKFGLRYPQLLVTPQDRLMVTAVGTVPVATGKSLVTSRQALVWSSENGTDWKGADHVGQSDYMVSSVVWHQGTAYSYGHGCICGSATTVQIRSSQEGERFGEQFEETFSFFPSRASLVFRRDKGYCLMSRSKGGMVGISNAPYDHWEWKGLGRRISRPKTLRLEHGKIVASVGLYDYPEETRTSLCWFDTRNLKLVEFLRLPIPDKALEVGLAFHDQHLWVSYHTSDEETTSIHLTKIKLPNAKR